MILHYYIDGILNYATGNRIYNAVCKVGTYYVARM